MSDTSLQPTTSQSANANPLTSTTSPTAAPSKGAALTYDQTENYWVQAGGNPQAAAMAAAVADASSGLDPSITRTNPDGTISVGLWLIPQNGTPPGSTDPLANARAAIQQSSNGTDWSQWCVAWSDNNCGQDGGTYLGNGANALGALSGPNEPYNVIGAVPSGSGTGASAATSAGATTGTSSGKSSAIYVIAALIIIALAIYFGRKQPSGGEVEPAGLTTQGGMEERPKPVVIPAHVRGLPSSDTSGPYAP